MYPIIKNYKMNKIYTNKYIMLVIMFSDFYFLVVCDYYFKQKLDLAKSINLIFFNHIKLSGIQFK